MKDREKIRQIYEALPKLNCGLCGFANCGHFARAVAQGKASPFGCKQNPLSGYEMGGIIGMKVPSYRYGLQPLFASRPGGSPSPKVLRKEVRGLAQRVDGVLARIENLKTRGERMNIVILIENTVGRTHLLAEWGLGVLAGLDGLRVRPRNLATSSSGTMLAHVWRYN